MKSVAGRIALAMAGIVVGFVLLEGLLQVASIFVDRGSRGVDPATGRLRVLCLGDSNTYGISVERDEAWPARLQQRWASRGLEPGIEVINLGYPGTNSSQVVRDFERNLDRFDPRVVLVEVGSNDFWTVPVPTDSSERSSALDWIRQHSRLFRLVYMATRPHDEPARDDTRIGGDFDPGYEAATAVRPGIAGDLERNLRTLQNIAGERGVALVFVTYASGELFYAAATMVMQKVAQQTGTPLVHLRPAFRSSVCRVEPCPEWIFPEAHPARHHPTARGYELVAETVGKELEILVPGLASRSAAP